MSNKLNKNVNEENPKEVKINLWAIVAIVVCLVVFIVLGIWLDNSDRKELKDEQIQTTQNSYEDVEKPIATIRVRDYGKIVVELEPAVALNTVENFMMLSNANFYKGLTFNKKGDDFIQVGAMDSDDGRIYAMVKDFTLGTDEAYYTIEGEFENNSIKHEQGTISMVRDYSSDTASYQFFITTGENVDYDQKYTAFGKVLSGFDILQQIYDDLDQNVYDINSDPVLEKDKQSKDIVIDKIEIETHGVYYKSPDIIKQEEKR